jgi:hypothetical protein
VAAIPPEDGVPFPPPPSGDRDDRFLDVVAELGELRARVEQLTRDRDQDKETIAELTQLGPTVEGLSEAVVRSTTLGPALSARGEDEEAPAAPWCWITMSPGEQADRVLELARWVRDVLRGRYPGRTESIRACWPEHPTVLEELGWLYGEWRMAYLDEDGTHRHVGEWHDRWLDGVLGRFDRDKEFGACEQTHAEQLVIAKDHGPDSVAVLRARNLQARQEVQDQGNKKQD